MYKYSNIGPWPILDIGQPIQDSTTSLVATAVQNPLQPFLHTENLGGSDEAYVTQRHYDSAGSLTAYQAFSWGVLLKPFSSVGVSSTVPLYLDIYININALVNESSTSPCNLFAFVGTVDKALTPSAGYDAVNNLVADYALLPMQSIDTNVAAIATQVLLKDIVSGGLDEDDYIAVGVGILNGQGPASLTCKGMYGTISARYCTATLATGGSDV